MAYESFFVQEAERVSKLNNCCYNGSGHFATAFCQMNSNKKKEVIFIFLNYWIANISDFNNNENF
jgi:hypothetical protein